MSSLRVLFFCCSGFALLPVQAALGQQSANSDDIKASLRSCQVVRASLEARARSPVQVPVRADDETTAAGAACDQLDKAIANSNQAEIQSATAALRPILAQLDMAPATPQEKLAALEAKTGGLTGIELFSKLPWLAKRAANAGEWDKAEAYAKQLLEMAPQYAEVGHDPTAYGNAIFYGNLVLGRVALQHGNVAQASQYLLAAGGTPGSAPLDSFGPNMTLAKELLEKGQSDVVLQFFALCRNFWKDDYGKLDEWSATVRGGGVPEFGANLKY